MATGDTTWCIFLAPVRDTRPGKEHTVYGTGHETEFDSDDHEFLIAMHQQGKVAYLKTETAPEPPPLLA